MKVRKISLSLIAIAISILLIVSCSSEPEVANGKLSIKIASSITKGISPTVDLETANYRIEIAEANGNSQTLNIGTDSAAEQSLPAGSYTAKAYAENAVGTVIGESEEKSFTIYPNRTTSVSLDIFEKEGEGSISISFEGLGVFAPETEFSVLFKEGLDGGLNEAAAKTVALSFSEDGTASASATLPNGFYAIFLESSDDAADLFLDTVRVVNGDELSASYSFEFSGTGEIVVTNNIAKTPSIIVSKSGDELPITLSATIENLGGNASYAWYMDGMLISGANEKDLNITSESDISAGNHEFILIVISDIGIVWTSDAIMVSILPSMRTFDLSRQDLDNGFEVEVGADESIMLTNVNIADGVIAEITDLGGSKGIGNNKGCSSGFMTQSGDFMFSPDKNMNAYFNGSDNGAKNNLRLKIKKFENIQSDFAITAAEYEGLPESFFEEFYYVDFTNPKYSDLDLENIVIFTDGAGHQGYKLLQYGMDIINTRGVLDFSDYPGFGIYSWYRLDPVQHFDARYSFYIQSVENISSLERITNKKGVIRVNQGDCDKITFTLSERNDEVFNYLIKDSNMRTVGGDYQDLMAIPVIDTSNNTVTLYLGDFDEDILIDYQVADMNTEDGIPVEIFVSKSFASENEKPIQIDLKDITEEGFSVTDIPNALMGSDYITMSYTCSEDIDLDVDTFAFIWSTTTNGAKRFNSSGLSWMTNYYGYTIIDKSMLQEDDILVRKKIDNRLYIEDGHAIKSSTSNKFYLDDANNTEISIHDYCSGGFVSENIFDGKDENGNTLHEDYGLLSFNWGYGLSSSRYSLPGLSIYGDGEYSGLYGNNMIDSSIAVDVKPIEFWIEDNLVTKILCKVTIGNGENNVFYDNVSFIRNDNLSHIWNLYEDKAVCKLCNEERHLERITLNSNCPTITISGVKDFNAMVELHVPLTDNIFYCHNQIMEYPNLFDLVGVEEFDVYLIAPSEDSIININGDANNKNFTANVVFLNQI